MQIARGEDPTLVFNVEQGRAFAVVFGVGDVDMIMHSYYAEVENPSDEEASPKEARLKFLGIKPETPSHFLISQGLARDLGIKEGEDIRIKKVYAKPEEINLDKL